MDRMASIQGEQGTQFVDLCPPCLTSDSLGCSKHSDQQPCMVCYERYVLYCTSKASTHTDFVLYGIFSSTNRLWLC